MRRRRGITHTAVNATVVKSVVLTPDPYSAQLVRDVTGEIASRLQGHGGTFYTGDKGDPTRSFNGPIPTPQTFVGAGRMAANRNVYRDEAGRTIDTGDPNHEGPFADVTMRMFALRASRRSPS